MPPNSAGDRVDSDFQPSVAAFHRAQIGAGERFRCPRLSDGSIGRRTIARMIAGVILAAGRSTRMGRPKSLLTCPDGRTFTRALVDALRSGGVSPLLIVGRPDDRALQADVEAIGSPVTRVTPVTPVTFVANFDADAGGQLSSVLAGLREADRPGTSAVMIVPVDAPLITAETVSTLIAVFAATAAPVVRARCQGRNGHPVIFSRALFDELRAADPALGAKAVLREHAAEIVNVDVDDPGVLGDVDTPEDYRKLIADQT